MNLAIPLSPFPGQVPGMEWIQILDSSSGPLLLSSGSERTVNSGRTTVFSVPLQGGPSTELLTHHQVVHSTDRWDAAVRPDGRIVVAFDVFTGGDFHVEISGPGAASRPWVLPPTMAPDGSYQFSRFVRGLPGRMVVSALRWGVRPVVFADLELGEDPDEGRSSRTIELKCTGAIVVADRDGLGLVYQTPSTGPPNAPHDLTPGDLGYVRLGPDLQPILPATPLFPRGVVTEFDAAPLADGLAVVAAAGTKLAVAVVGRGQGGWEVLGRREEPLQDKPRSPSIRAVSGKLHVAAIVEGRVLIGQVAFGP
jgi:hypothetical protein